MADKRIAYTEQMVGYGHPSLADTLNRLTLVSHNSDGSHKGWVNAAQEGNIMATLAAVPATTTIMVTDLQTVTPGTTIAHPIIVMPEGYINVASGTVTISGPFEAGIRQAFTGSGAISFSKIGVVHPEWWGTNGAGIQAAFRSLPYGGTVKLSPNTSYPVTTTIYADMTTFDADWTLEGAGQSSVISSTGIAESGGNPAYILRLNETSGGAEATGNDTYPGMRFTLRNFAVEATEGASSTTSFARAWQCGVTMEGVRLDYIKFGLRNYGYCDLTKVVRCEVVHAVTDGYLFYQQQLGDALVFEQNTMTPYGTWNGMLYLRGSSSALIRNNIQGSYFIRDCRNVNFISNHIETVHGVDAKVQFNNSQGQIRGNTLYNFKSPTLDVAGNTLNYPIMIDDVTADPSGNVVFPASHVTIADNHFVVAQFTNNVYKERQEVYIKPSAYTVVVLDNNKHEFSDGVLSQYYHGISVGSSNAGLQTELTLKSFYLSGGVTIARSTDSGHKVLNADGTNVFNVPLAGKPVIYGGGRVNTRPLSGDEIVDGTTYYYRVATQNIFGTSDTAAEVNYLATVGRTGAIELIVLNPAPNTVVRIWRGVSPGVYDRYVDIPAIQGDNHYFDCGLHVDGFPWVKAGIPAVTTSETGFRGVYRDGRRTVYVSSIPTVGAFTAGDRAEYTGVTVNGSGGYVTANQKYVLVGWQRLTTGSNHVLNTDWAELRALTGA